MLRALAKSAVLFGFGRAPGGPALYRQLTRARLGTQATHVDKLQRVWPGYVNAWRERCGLSLEGRDVWIHEAGWTPFSGFAIHLLTGKGGALTNSDAEMLDRYLARAVSGALACKWPEGAVPEARRQRIDGMRWADGSRSALESLGCALHEQVAPGRIPLHSESMDLVHSGGALEHLSPEELDSLIAECRRILRPGGIASHVLDHRDHLYHADKHWPFLAHQAFPAPIYSALFGHPLLFHNRLLPEEVCRRFEAAGFKRIAVRRMILPAGRYAPDDEVCSGLAGLPKGLRPAKLSPLDLHTAAAHYLFVRI